MYWRPDPRATLQRTRKQLADMRDHGMNAVATDPPRPMVRVENGTLLVDAGKTVEFLRLVRREGLTGPIPAYANALEGWTREVFGRRDFESNLKRLVAEIVRISERPDTPELLFYPVDEIGGSKTRQDRFIRIASLIHAVPGARVYLTANNFEGGVRCAEQIDIWCSNIPLTRVQEKFVADRGKTYMRYGSHFTKDPRRARSSAGFGLFARGAAAMYYWHYQMPNGDPFDDLDGRARDWCAAYPGPDGPLPTLDWEAIREGVDDLRYIHTLELLAERCRSMGGPPAAAAAEAHARLDQILHDESGRTDPYRFKEDLGHDDFHALRRRVADLAIGLEAAAGDALQPTDSRPSAHHAPRPSRSLRLRDDLEVGAAFR